MTPAGIEPATFRFVAQHLNDCATAVPAFKGASINAIQLAAVAIFTISVDAFTYTFILIRLNLISCLVFVWVWNLVYHITVEMRKYSRMDKRANDKLVRSPGENGGG